MMITNFNDYYAATMLMAYFMFLLGILYMTRNVEQIAHHRMMEALVHGIQDNVRYNLRDIPRVDYKEISSDEEQEESTEEKTQHVTSEASDEESEVESEEVESEESEVDQTACKRRRDPNPIGRMIDSIY